MDIQKALLMGPALASKSPLLRAFARLIPLRSPGRDKRVVDRTFLRLVRVWTGQRVSR